jgi:hypothetical protein
VGVLEAVAAVADAPKSLESFKRSAVYGQPVDLARGIRATFVDAGHILGSANILLELTEADRRLLLLFSATSTCRTPSAGHAGAATAGGCGRDRDNTR